MWSFLTKERTSLHVQMLMTNELCTNKHKQASFCVMIGKKVYLWPRFGTEFVAGYQRDLKPQT